MKQGEFASWTLFAPLALTSFILFLVSRVLSSSASWFSHLILLLPLRRSCPVLLLPFFLFHGHFPLIGQTGQESLDNTYQLRQYLPIDSKQSRPADTVTKAFTG